MFLCIKLTKGEGDVGKSTGLLGKPVADGAAWLLVIKRYTEDVLHMRLHLVQRDGQNKERGIMKKEKNQQGQAGF